jgi:hypothetical protein
VKLIVPSEQEIDIKGWPTLGHAVARHIETTCVFGPGDLKGQPAKLDDLKRAWLWILYQIYPEGHPRAGRRRYKRGVLSIRKGTAKSEFAAWIAHAELHPSAPVRFHRWSKTGPIGRPVHDPFIPMVATAEEQTEELAYGAVYSIAQDAPKLAGLYDVGLERVARLDGNGKCSPFAASPDSSDGARTTFEHFDETHRFTQPRLKKAHRTMLNNLLKRRDADAWALETTTMFSPGEKSVAEEAYETADAINEERRKPIPGFFYFHLGAGDQHDVNTPEGLRAAVLEGSGPMAAWSDVEGIIEEAARSTDFAYYQRVWLNRRVKSADKAFDALAWARRSTPDYKPADGVAITIGFDGAQVDDATAAIATEIVTGFQWPLGIWEKPHDAGKDWRVSEARVDEAIADAFKRYDVFRMYADPFYWGNWINAWAGRYGEKRVIVWATNRWRKASDMVRAYDNAMQDSPAELEFEPDPEDLQAVPEPADEKAKGAVQRLSHNGDPVFARHVGNAHKMPLNIRDKRGERLWAIQKERHDSPNKIDAAMAGALSWEARRDAVTLGLGVPAPAQSYRMDWVG